MINDGQILQFHYVNVDGCETNVDVLTRIITTNGKKISEQEVEDAISSYIDTVEDWEFEELICDILQSFNIVFDIVSPITFNI